MLLMYGKFWLTHAEEVWRPCELTVLQKDRAFFRTESGNEIVLAAEKKAELDHVEEAQLEGIDGPRWHQGTIAPRALKRIKNKSVEKCPKVNLSFEGVLRT